MHTYIRIYGYIINIACSTYTKRPSFYSVFGWKGVHAWSAFTPQDRQPTRIHINIACRK